MIDTIGTAKIPAMSVAVADPNGVLFAGAVGHAELSEPRPATVEDQYPWFSMTKIATATTAMRLHADGVLDLDAPIGEVLPNYRPHPRTAIPRLGSCSPTRPGSATPCRSAGVFGPRGEDPVAGAEGEAGRSGREPPPSASSGAQPRHYAQRGRLRPTMAGAALAPWAGGSIAIALGGYHPAFWLFASRDGGRDGTDSQAMVLAFPCTPGVPPQLKTCSKCIPCNAQSSVNPGAIARLDPFAMRRSGVRIPSAPPNPQVRVHAAVLTQEDGVATLHLFARFAPMRGQAPVRSRRLNEASRM